MSTCASVAEAKAQSQRADAYLIDVRLPDGSGIDLVRWMKSNDVDAPMLMISGHGTIADAVEATRAGAFDFLEKPLSREKVLLSLEARARRDQAAGRKSALARDGGRSADDRRQRRLRARAGTGDDGRAQRCARLARRRIGDRQGIARGAYSCREPVLRRAVRQSELRGDPHRIDRKRAVRPRERRVHGATSARRGKFELADGGTLFLDEVGDLHASSQAKLLRVLQEGEFHRVGGEQSIRVTVRVIGGDQSRSDRTGHATEISRGSVLSAVRRPGAHASLRERRDDIRPLAEYFLGEFCARNNFKPKQFDAAAFEALEDYSWPGNIRELRNTVERMAILTRGDMLEAESVPVEIRIARPPGGGGICGKPKNRPSANTFYGRSKRASGMSRARPACWGWNGRICISASGRLGLLGGRASSPEPGM